VDLFADVDGIVAILNFLELRGGVEIDSDESNGRARERETEESDETTDKRGERGQEWLLLLPVNNAWLDNIFQFQDASAIVKILEEVVNIELRDVQGVDPHSEHSLLA
jgi:hypothetical protein